MVASGVRIYSLCEYCIATTDTRKCRLFCGMKVNVVTLCSGYDSQALALERLKRNFPDFDYELVAWAEFDPESKQPLEKQPAVIAHNALFPQWSDRNMGDITTADWSKVGEVDLLTYSTPCTDISNAGRQMGAEKDSGTRSSIIWHTEKAIRALRPKFLLMENVANFVSKAHIGTFKAWYSLVENLGYNNFAQVLNATSYGIPQNRERIFLVSIRKDISDKYHFPQPIKLEKRFKDVFESNVDEKYYLSEKLITSLSHDNKGFKAMKPSTPPHIGVASCLAARMHKMGRGDNYIMETNIPICLNSKVDGKQPSLQDRVYSVDGVATALTTCFLPNIAEPIAVAMRGRNPENPSERGKSNGRYKQRLEPNVTGCANTITSVQKDCLVAETKVIQVGNIYPDTDKFKNRTMGRVYDTEGIAPTINTCGEGGREPKVVVGEVTSDNLLELVQAGLVRMRKITPREAFRLMDLEESDIDTLLSSGLANTSLYQLAGNSICVGVLYHLFRKMFIETENESEQMTLF